MGTRIGSIHANVTAKDLSWSDTMRRVREETKRTADLLHRFLRGHAQDFRPGTWFASTGDGAET